jgi:hypothetical protein
MLRPLLFIVKSFCSVSEPILFADDNSVIIYKKISLFLYSVKLRSVSCKFAADKLVLNQDKIKVITNNSLHCVLSIGYKEEYIEGTVNTKSLPL